MLGLLLMLLAAEPGQPQTTARADQPSPDNFDTAVFLTGEIAAAVPLAAQKLLGPPKAKDCFSQLQSYRVHVSIEGEVITVVLLPNKRCGEGIKGGGGRVTLDAKTLKLITKKGYE